MHRRKPLVILCVCVHPMKIEKKTEKGETVYEALINKNGKEWSIEVDANGKFLKQYEESKEKGEKGEKY